MKLIVGLGNPGEKYEKTRHNIGWQTADALAEKEKWRKNIKANCFYIKKQICNQEIEIVKPLGLMNNSGVSVGYIKKKYNLKAEDVIVIHDDIDLNLGRLKICQNRSSAGHKGVQSIIDHLKTKNFIRFRIGIKQTEQSNNPPARGRTKRLNRKIPAERFVLEKFNKDEQKKADQIIKLTTEAICLSLQQGIKAAMNKYN